MADSTQGANETLAHEQKFDNNPGNGTATEDHRASGDTGRAVHIAAAHVHRDAAPTRRQTAYPTMAVPVAALSSYNVNNTGHATGRTDAWADEQLMFPMPDHPSRARTPPQSIWSGIERGSESESRTEQLERPNYHLPATPEMREAWNQQPRREHRHHAGLPPILAGQTAEQSRETTLPSTRALTDFFDAQRQQRTLPSGHLRETPNTWVAERDLSYEHRRARVESLSFEYDIHEIDHILRRAQYNIQRYLDECSKRQRQ